MSLSHTSFSVAPRILVVDDVADNRFLLQVLLESEGYEVDTAPEGYTAIAKIETNPPDLILLDLMMPDLDGYGVADWLEHNCPYTPILVITGSDQFPDFCHGSKLIADCIRKPLVFEELLDKAQAFISISYSRRQCDPSSGNENTWN